MKKNFHFFIVGLFCIAILMSSCNNELIEELAEAKTGKQQMTFTVQRDNNSIGSRTTLTPDFDILWEETDKIVIFDSEGNRNYFTLVDGAGTTCATFTGEAVPSDKYYAVYPTSVIGKPSENVFNMVLVPSYNRPIPDKLYYNLMTGISTDSKNIQFHNALAYAKITITEECKNIRLIGGPNDRLGGTYFDFTVDENGAFVSAAQHFPNGGYSNDIHMWDMYDNGLIQPGTYYLGLLPGTLSELTLECRNADGTGFWRSINREVHSFEESGVVMDFGTVSKEEGWNDFHLCPDGNHPHMIDLGLPSGKKWSCMNLGAEEPVGYGDYFAWGEVTPQDSKQYGIATYKWCANSNYIMTKYVASSDYGTVDGKTVLDTEDDAAIYQWGTPWRMPTSEEIWELHNNCRWIWTTRNGVNGYDVISKKAGNANMIFLPAAGFYNEGQLVRAGVSGGFWTTTLYEEESNLSFDMFFDSKRKGESRDGRWAGLSIRPVSE